ncbi:MAG: hypothetical protein Q7K42_01375, partial [Candidatus Diapherotrites archaeon]|nr:hypothetical protein [Candidatus Diapherotrites archaeon]
MDNANFFNNGQFLLIELLLEKNYYLRELAERSSLAPSSVYKIMSELVSKMIVLAEKKKNLKFFSLNYNSSITTSILRLIFV